MSYRSQTRIFRLIAGTTALAAAAGGCADQEPVAPMLAARAPASITAGLEAAHGPERFVRGTGAPQVETREISLAGFESPFELRVTSGNADGTARVSSATISLNGVEALGPSAFNQQRSEWRVPVSPDGVARLTVSIAGKPGSHLDVSLFGRRAGVLFCSDGRPGSVQPLQAAIDATPPGGTLLVCDGIHDVSSSTINKPMTLRSRSPGGATLRDADTPGAGQGGEPLLWINGVAAGVVRITDIALMVNDQGIRPAGTFDQVEIDNVRFTGTGTAGTPTTVVAVRVDASAVPGARVNVSNSRFSELILGVWPVNRVETNVRHSTFDRFGGGGVVYSHGNTAETQSFGRTEHNTFTNCGAAGCIRVLTAGAVVVANNRLEARDQVVNLGAITATPSPHVGAQRKVFENNVIVSRPTGSDPAQASGWYFRSAIFISDQPGVEYVVRGNRMDQAHTALQFTSDLDAQDNVISGGVYAFQQGASRVVRFQRNDVVGTLASFTAVNAGGQYQCNWWGSTAGPVSPPPNIPAPMYSPWATAPIAGTANPCDVPNLLVRVCHTGGGATVPTLEQAVGMVSTGGTIRLCDGTHAASGVTVSRAMTIESEGPGVATLDGGNAGTALNISGAPAGNVVFLRKLRFVGGTFANVFVGTNGREVQVTASEFNPPLTAPYGGTRGWLSGLQVGGTGIGTVAVANNRFLGGDVGYHINSPSGNSQISANEFDGQANSAVHIAGPRPGGINLNSNVMRNCGPEWCVFSQHSLAASQNTITIDISRPTVSPLRLDQMSPGTSSITGNVIVGTGNGGADRTARATYPITSHAIHVVGSANLFLNRITNAYSGIGATPGVITGERNFIEHTFAPFSGGGSPGSNSIATHRNTILDYIVPLEHPGAFGSVNLRCNYWGSPTGPTGISGYESWYLPFHAQANFSDSCTP
jgi:hypothetical protein